MTLDILARLGIEDDADEALESVSASTLYREGPELSDESLRPKRFEDVIGQAHVKETLSVYVRAARRRGVPLDHILLSGPPGLGKTTIASVIAGEIGAGLIIDAGPALTRGKLLSHITTILETAAEEPPLQIVLMVDEAHGIPKDSIQILLPLLEDFRFVDRIIPRFTFVAATTDPAMLIKPFRERFPLRYHLEYYSNEDIFVMLKRSFRILWKLEGEEYDAYVDGLFRAEVDVEASELKGELVECDSPAAKALKMIAARAKGVPRVANQLLRRVQDFAIAHMPDHETDISKAPLTPDVVTMTMKAEGIDIWGLTRVERRVLAAIFQRFSAGRQSGIGVRAIAAAIGENADTVEHVIEPNLVRLGFVQRTERGRTLTELGLEVAVRELSGEVVYD